MTEDINEWVEDGWMEGCAGRNFGLLVLWITFLSFLGILYLCWMEGRRSVIGG